MIEIGPNLAELLNNIIGLLYLIAGFFFVHGIRKRKPNQTKGKTKEKFFSMDNPWIFLVMGIVLALLNLLVNIIINRF